MENLNGALGFQATLDIDDFNVSAQAMERRIQQVSSTAVQEGMQMETMFNRAATAFAGIVGIGAAKSFVQQMINVRSEMQNTEASFKVFLGTAERANEFFSDLQRYAYNNVFEFADLAKNASQLLAFRNQVEDVIPIIDKLSNIAAGANAPLGEFVSLFNKAKANNKLLSVDIQMWESRGVPVVYELAEAYGKTEAQIRQMVTAGKIGFKDLETVITKLTDRGGMFAGMMVEKMKTLGDSIGLLQDNITNMFNELGEANQGVLRGGILAVNSLVENYETVGRVLASLVTAYGTYKAAVIATNLATQSGTGITIVDNTVRALKLQILKAEQQMNGTNVVGTNAVKEAQAALNLKQKEYIAGLTAQLTQEQLLEVSHRARISAMTALLTAEQAHQLETLGITATDANYEQMVLGVLTAEQREALSKVDLTSKGALYQAELEREVAAKAQEQAAAQRSIEIKRQEVSAAHARVAAYKESAIAAQTAVESARYEVYWAKQSGDATRIATAEKKLEAAEENAAAARKAALGAQSQFLSEKKALEAMTSKKVAAGNMAEAASETVDATAKGVNTMATKGLTVAVRALWTALKANPLGWIITLVGAVISLLPFLKRKTDESTDAATEFSDSVQSEMTNLKMYTSILESAEHHTKSYKDALQKLSTLCTQYNVQLKDEQGNVRDLTVLYDELSEAIQRSAKAKILASNTELINRDAQETEEDALKKLKKNAGKASYTEYYYDPDDPDSGAGMTVNKSNSLRNAGTAIWEGVESLALDASKKVVSKDGEIIKAEFDKLLSDVLAKVQHATGASDKEIQGFSGDMRKYLETVMEAEAEAARKTKQLNDQLDGLFSAGTSGNQGASTDYAKMSFEELAEAAKSTQSAIDQINSKPVKVEADQTELQSLLETLGKINAATSTKEGNLNTEADINARIKQLKALKEQSVIGSAEYKKYEKQITDLQNKLPKQGESLAQKQEKLKQKELENQMRLEEAKLELIEDSWQREQAQRELQHQRTLNNIDKERKEYEKAAKAAGKKADTSSFDERVTAENQRYAKESNNLVDSEISYKKSQYELYWKWVDKLGKDVADKQFKDLLKGGESYKTWVQNELGKLGTQGSDGKFTANSGNSEGENRRFMLLGQEQDEILGSKSAMDLFNESLARAIQEAGTLAERIQAVASAKEKIASGESGLNEDEQAVALVGLNEKDAEYQRELQNTLLTDYQTYTERMQEIQTNYQALLSAAEAEGNSERVELVRKGMADAISALNAEILMGSESWKMLFSDLDALTVDEIDLLIQEIQTKLNSADLKMNPADLRAMLEQLDQVKRKLLDTNPFKAMGTALKAVFKESQTGAKKSSDQIKSDWTNLAKSTEGCFNFVNEAIDSCGALKDALGDTGAAILSTLQGITMAGIAMATAIKTAETASVILAAIGVALQIVNAIFSFVKPDAASEKRVKALEEDVKNLEKAYEKLERAMKKTYWVFTTEEQEAYDKRMAAIQAEIDAEQRRVREAAQAGTLNILMYLRSIDQVRKLKQELEAARRQGDMLTLYELEIENLERQKADLQRAIREERSQKKVDNDKIEDWESKITSVENKLEDLKEEMADTFAGTTVQDAISEFGDAVWDAVTTGENAVEALGKTIQETLKNAVKEALKRQFLAKGINDAIAYLSEAMSDSVLTDEERAKFEEMANQAGTVYKQAIEGIGSWLMDDTKADALSGAIASMSEETGGLVAGRLNAVVINQALHLEIVREQLAYQATIAANTGATVSELLRLNNSIDRIANAENNLLSQGIS